MKENDSLPTPDHLPNNSSNNTASFDPSEPQFFAEEGRDTDQSENISAVGNRSQNPYMESQSLEIMDPVSSNMQRSSFSVTV